MPAYTIIMNVLFAQNKKKQRDNNTNSNIIISTHINYRSWIHSNENVYEIIWTIFCAC